MNWILAFGFYVLIWMATLFAVLPFGVHTSEEAGNDRVAGQADSAPTQPRLGRKLLWTTIVSAVIFAVLRFAFSEGWIRPPV